MPTTYAIPNGRTVMDATTYAGNGTSSNTIVNADNGTVGFKPDLVWVKDRSSTTSQILVDSVRGASNLLVVNTSGAQQSVPSYITSFNSNGFSVGTNNVDLNASSNNYVGWQWQAGQGTTNSNTNGSITSTTSVNSSAGFSIVTFTGTGSAGTVGHGLSSAPSFIIWKTLNQTNNWNTYHSYTGNGSATQLNLNTGVDTNVNYWNNTSPTSSVFSVGSYTSPSSINCVAYCWAPVAGFSFFGSYNGNGSADGPFCYTGFQPKFIMIKRTDTTGYPWNMFDSSRSPYDVVSNVLFANTGDSESSIGSGTFIDILSNGFKCRNTAGDKNAAGGNYLFVAFASNPFKYSNAF